MLARVRFGPVTAFTSITSAKESSILSTARLLGIDVHVQQSGWRSPRGYSPRLYRACWGWQSCLPVRNFPSPSGFPYTPSNNPNTYGLAIAWGIDDNLKTPYSEVVDFSLTREFAHNFVLETTYTGRFAHHLLQEVDLAQPLDLVDPKSDMDYFHAAQMFRQGSRSRNVPDERSSQPIPYWENLFPQAAGPAGFQAMHSASVRSGRSSESHRHAEHVRPVSIVSLGNETTALEDRGRILLPGLRRHRLRRRQLATARARLFSTTRTSSLRSTAGRPGATATTTRCRSRCGTP